MFSSYVTIATNQYGELFMTHALCPADLVLPYPTRNLAAEIILLFVMALLDAIRIFLGKYLRQMHLPKIQYMYKYSIPCT